VSEIGAENVNLCKAVNDVMKLGLRSVPIVNCFKCIPQFMSGRSEDNIGTPMLLLDKLVLAFEQPAVLCDLSIFGNGHHSTSFSKWLSTPGMCEYSPMTDLAHVAMYFVTYMFSRPH